MNLGVHDHQKKGSTRVPSSSNVSPRTQPRHSRPHYSPLIIINTYKIRKRRRETHAADSEKNPMTTLWIPFPTSEISSGISETHGQKIKTLKIRKISPLSLHLLGKFGFFSPRWRRETEREKERERLKVGDGDFQQASKSRCVSEDQRGFLQQNALGRHNHPRLLHRHVLPLLLRTQ